MKTITDELKELKDLLDSGVIGQGEFLTLKNKIINGLTNTENNGANSNASAVSGDNKELIVAIQNVGRMIVDEYRKIENATDRRHKELLSKIESTNTNKFF